MSACVTLPIPNGDEERLEEDAPDAVEEVDRRRLCLLLASRRGDEAGIGEAYASRRCDKAKTGCGS